MLSRFVNYLVGLSLCLEDFLDILGAIEQKDG